MASNVKNVKILKNYDEALRKLREGIDHVILSAGFESPASALHALFEVAAHRADSTGFDFENYVRAALCAYDCHQKRGVADGITVPTHRMVN